jgi:hypothetical protein
MKAASSGHNFLPVSVVELCDKKLGGFPLFLPMIIRESSPAQFLAFGMVGLREIAVYVEREASDSSGPNGQNYPAKDHNTCHVGEGLHVDRYQTRTMLIRVIESVQRVGVGRQLCSFSKAGLKFILVALEWKGDAHWASRISGARWRRAIGRAGCEGCAPTVTLGAVGISGRAKD